MGTASGTETFPIVNAYLEPATAFPPLSRRFRRPLRLSLQNFSRRETRLKFAELRESIMEFRHPLGTAESKSHLSARLRMFTVQAIPNGLLRLFLKSPSLTLMSVFRETTPTSRLNCRAAWRACSHPLRRRFNNTAPVDSAITNRTVFALVQARSSLPRGLTAKSQLQDSTIVAWKA